MNATPETLTLESPEQAGNVPSGVVGSTALLGSVVRDKNGREIQPGDTLKIFHFIGRRRKRFYMYKYVEAIVAFPEWKDGLTALRVAHLNVANETCLILRRGQWEKHIEIVQGYGYGDDRRPFDERPILLPNVTISQPGPKAPKPEL
jgi:hypothetical protein